MVKVLTIDLTWIEVFKGLEIDLLDIKSFDTTYYFTTFLESSLYLRSWNICSKIVFILIYVTLFLHLNLNSY